MRATVSSTEWALAMDRIPAGVSSAMCGLPPSGWDAVSSRTHEWNNGRVNSGYFLLREGTPCEDAKCQVYSCRNPAFWANKCRAALGETDYTTQHSQSRVDHSLPPFLCSKMGQSFYFENGSRRGC